MKVDDDAPETTETSLAAALPEVVKPPDDPVERDRWGRRLRLTGLVAAACAVGFMWLDSRAGWLDYQPGGTAFFTYVRPVFYGMLVLGALASLKWEFAGGVIAGLAAGAIGTIAVNQLVGRHAILVIVLLAVPASAWLLADLSGWSERRGVAAIVTTVAAVVSGSVVGEQVYERQFGPTHPPSDLEALPDSAVRWIWSGGVTSTEADVRAAVDDQVFDTARIAVTITDDFADAIFHPADDADGRIVSFAISDLEPGVRHRYAVEIDGELDLVRAGEFTTFPDEAASFSFTVGACARVGSNGSVFDTIRQEGQLFHLITGDFHYGDIPDDDRARYDEVIDLTLRQPAQAALYRSVPIAYVWDDHDYGINDSSFSSESRVAAMEAYRANVPSYPLAGDLSPVFQSFDVGRVRFLVTDARSAREPGETMLGESQLAWLLDALVTASEERELVVWVNPVPWLAEAEPGADHWGGYADERRRIADVIAEHDIDQLLMISGDAHMVAIDDGTNTDYSAQGDAGFPLLHAAPLDRPGSIKGGPYSVGAVGESGQYGLVEIDDDGETIRVELVAKRYDGDVLLRHDFEVGDG